MTTPHDAAMQDFTADLFARATEFSEVVATAPDSPLVVRREGVLSDPAPDLDRMARLFVAELFGLDS